MRFSIELRQGYLLARLAGRERAEDTRQFAAALKRACRTHGCPRALVAVSASRALFKPEDYGLDGAARGYAAALLSPDCQLALVGDTPELHSAHEYIEMVARQQHVNLRAFRDEPSAARWLAGAPEPSRRYRFRPLVMQGAPEDAGVYALWDEDELVYYGRAASIRARLFEHYEAGEGATHYSWEMCDDPPAREAELLREFERLHGRPPRRNAQRG